MLWSNPAYSLGLTADCMTLAQELQTGLRVSLSQAAGAATQLTGATDAQLKSFLASDKISEKCCASGKDFVQSVSGILFLGRRFWPSSSSFTWDGIQEP